MIMNELKAMGENVPAATATDLAGARRRLIAGMRPRRRAVTMPRLLVAAGVAAAAAVTPLVAATGPAAYAVSRGPDGTLTVTLDELRDPEGLEAELAGAGVKADVTFLQPGTRCAVPRFEGADDAYGGPPAQSPDALREQVAGTRSFKAVRSGGGAFQIFPRYIGPGETLVLEFSDGENAQVRWRLGSWLARAGSDVRPCVPVDGG